MDLVDVELIKESLMCALVGSSGERRHVEALLEAVTASLE